MVLLLIYPKRITFSSSRPFCRQKSAVSRKKCSPSPIGRLLLMLPFASRVNVSVPSFHLPSIKSCITASLSANAQCLHVQHSAAVPHIVRAKNSLPASPAQGCILCRKLSPAYFSEGLQSKRRLARIAPVHNTYAPYRKSYHPDLTTALWYLCTDAARARLLALSSWPSFMLCKASL